MSNKQIYFTLITACSAGYIWIFLHASGIIGSNDHVTGCIIKSISGVPCPSCGSTRSVISILNGDLIGGLFYNPLGPVLLMIMLVLSVLLIRDGLLSKRTTAEWYRSAEQKIKKKYLAMPLIMAILINWMWNIYKGL
jgi:hypothetical protein